MSNEEQEIPSSWAQESQPKQTTPPTPPRPKPEVDIFKKLDRIIESLDVLAHELNRIADFLTGTQGIVVPSKPVAPPLPPSAGTTPVEKETTVPTPIPTPSPSQAKLKKVQEAFPSELAELLYFNVEKDWVIIKPRQYLGSENFAKIASVVRNLGGEYVSAGKESHFRV